jgi:hypothetical protein
MRSRRDAGWAAAVTTLAAIVAIGGCQSGDTGGRAPRESGTSISSCTVAKASAVTVTYYYLPG